MSGLTAAEGFTLQLAQVASMLDACCRDGWWLIGSSALALTIAEADPPADIDVLASHRDAVACIERYRDSVDARDRPGGDDRFRSTFARFTFSPLPVDVMGGLEVRNDGAWMTVVVQDSRMIECAGRTVTVPTPYEQIRLFELFGRDKDLVKARGLRERIGLEAAHAVFG